MENNQEKKGKLSDEPLKAIELNDRQHWTIPAIIFAGVEFCVPVMMIGSTLTTSFSIPTIFLITLIGMLIVTWPVNALSGYIGSKTGQSSSASARSSFGNMQARIIISLMIAITVLGHWGMQTAVAGNAICALIGVDYTAERGIWAIIVIIAGLVFAIPSILGMSSMKWTDYICVPAGVIICIGGIYLALKSAGGLSEIISAEPVAAGSMTLLAGINLIVSLNSAQAMVVMDYTRYAKPTIKDNLKIPAGVVVIGFPLVMVGAMMAVGNGNYDIVAVMTELGFPVWGFIILWLATWTSQLSNNYSAGLSLCNTFNVNSDKGRKIVTFLATVFAIILSLLGILEHFTDLYTITGLVFPAMAGVIIADYFLRKKGYQYEAGNWNWIATIALAIGGFIGIMTAYIYSVGIPMLQTLIATIFVYYFMMKLKLDKEKK